MRVDAYTTFAFLAIAGRKQLFTVLSHQGNHLDGRVEKQKLLLSLCISVVFFLNKMLFIRFYHFHWTKTACDRRRFDQVTEQSFFFYLVVLVLKVSRQERCSVSKRPGDSQPSLIEVYNVSCSLPVVV